MSSEVEDSPLATRPARHRRRFDRARRLLQRPFRSVLHQQALVNRNLGAAARELRDSQERFEVDVSRAIGDLNGHLLGEMADLRLAVHQLESRLQKVERQSGCAPPTAGESVHVVGIAPSDRRPAPLPDGAGINVIGDLTATTGLAQAARRLVVGLRQRGVPMTFTAARSGAPQIDELYPAELRGLAEGTAYRVDLVTLNVNEVSTLGAVDFGIQHTGRPAVGLWAWEFETLAPELVDELDGVDEIWVPSTFVQRSLGRYTSKPIHVVPNIVPVFTTGSQRDEQRRRWGIDDDLVTFLFSFDFNSSVVRKNPLGVVDAYRRAFGRDGSGTRLVIKAINLANSHAFESDLRAAVEGVGGVLIDGHLAQAELAELFHAVDVYVSLHRSEGFGLGMAEAMAIGKPVIGTAYSGNVDFMNGANSCLVGYRLRPITQHDHRYSPAVGTVYQPGFLVAEPDVEQAAGWMRALAADPDLRERIGTAAAATIASRCSEEVVVDTAMARLEARWGAVGGPGSDGPPSPE